MQSLSLAQSLPSEHGMCLLKLFLRFYLGKRQLWIFTELTCFLVSEWRFDSAALVLASSWQIILYCTLSNYKPFAVTRRHAPANGKALPSSLPVNDWLPASAAVRQYNCFVSGADCREADDVAIQRTR